jgi:hypothetical protein
MLEGISKNIISALPTVSTGCFVVAGALAGRKVVSAGVCKAGAVVLGLMGKPNAAEWNKSSHDYLTQAKKDAFKDLTKAAGFALAGFGAKYAGEALKELPIVDPVIAHDWQTTAIGAAVIIGSFFAHRGFLGIGNAIINNS